MAPDGWRAHFSPFDWGALLTAAAVVEAALLLLIGLVLGDLETLTFGLVVTVTTGLLFVRRNRLALLVRFAVFADVEFWMASGAAANLTHGGGAGAVLPPLALAVTSAVGLLASAVSLASRHRVATRVPRRVAIIAVAVVLVGTVFATMSHTSAAKTSADLRISIKNAHYSTTTLSARSHGGKVAVQVTNQDLFWHTFTSPGLGIDERFPVKAQRTITITAKPGVYRFYCAIPGHAQIGMKGTLTIQ